MKRDQHQFGSRADLRRIARLFVPYRRRLVGLLGLMACSAVLGVAPALFLQEIFDTAIPKRDTELLTLLVGGMIGVAIVTGVIGVAHTYVSHQVGQRVMHDLRQRVYSHLQRMSLAFFTRTRTGEILSRIGNDVGGVQSVVATTASTVLSSFTTVLAAVAAMFLLDWRLALISLVLLPPAVLITRRVGRERRRITSVRQEKLAQVSTLVEEWLSVSGFLLGRTTGQGGELTRRFGHESLELAGIEVRHRTSGQWLTASITIAFAIAPAAIYWIAGQSLVGSISIGTLVAFTTLQARMFGPVIQLLAMGVGVQSSLALFDRIFEYLDLPADTAERSGAVSVSRAAMRGELTFERVSFRYDVNSPWTLREVDFTAKPGTKTAIVGATGAGKTTLVYLVARLYQADRGRVLVDGHDVRDLTLSSLTDLVGYVSQETFLFHATVRENLRFAQPQATDEQIEDAARVARVHDLIAGLPEGYETVVGEHGYRFSGGEKQRIAIARTVLRDPQLLVLDEATNALDAATERSVQQGLDLLSEGRTALVVAHRLSAVRDADQILVLHDGQIVERGVHDELMGRAGRYAALVAGDVLVA